jgi:hypothetical protein
MTANMMAAATIRVETWECIEISSFFCSFEMSEAEGKRGAFLT